MKKSMFMTFILGVLHAVGCGDDTSSPTGTPSACTLNLKYTSCTISAGTIYVDANAARANNGSSWADGYIDLQSALDSACAGGGNVIQVAEGTYYPTSDSSDRCALFEMIDNVTIQGGFPSGGGSADPATYSSILSGDIDRDGLLDSDNSYHVVYGADGTLDGFTITMGYADTGSDLPSDYTSYDGIITVETGHENDEILRIVSGVKYITGGGMPNLQSAPQVQNCIFESNYALKGGAVYNMAATDYPTYGASYSAATFADCVFRNNSASRGGAILFRTGSDAAVQTGATFSGNTATDRGGAVFIDYGALPAFTGVTFSANSSDGYGGAVYVDDNVSQITTTSPVLSSCTFSGNSTTASYRGAIFVYNIVTDVTVSNSSFSSNSSASDSADLGCRFGATVNLSGNTGLNSQYNDGCTIQ